MTQEFLSQCPEASSKASQAVQNEFSRITSVAHFDSLNLLLDFSKFLEEHSTEPHTSWKTLFSNYTPNPRSIYESSNGGTSFLFALLAQDLCAQHGITSVIIPQQRDLSRLFFFPQAHLLSPSPPEKWNNAYDILQGITHLMCVYREQSSDRHTNEGQIIALQKYFTDTPPALKFHSFHDFAYYLHQYSASDPHPLDHTNDFLKKSLSISLVSHVIHPQDKSTLTFNLLSGLLSVTPCLFPTIPLNTDGKASFSITNLYEHPDHSTPVLIGNEPRILNNKSLLDLFLDGIRSAFSFHPDFATSLLFLIANRRKMFEEVFCPPSLCLLNLWDIYTDVDKLRRQAHFLRENLGLESSDTIKKSFFDAENQFGTAETLMRTSSPEESRAAFLEAKKAYINFYERCAIKEKIPYSALLLDFSE